VGFQQRRSSEFGSETIQGNGLQVAFRFQSRQERGQGHCAITHGALVGNVIDNLHRLRLRVLEQISGLPRLLGMVEFDGQLCCRSGKRDQQGEEGEDRFQEAGPV